MKGCQTHTRYAVIVLCVIHGCSCGCYEAVNYLVVTFEGCYCLHNYTSETLATFKCYVSHVLSPPGPYTSYIPLNKYLYMCCL